MQTHEVILTSPRQSPQLEVLDWGLVDYHQSLDLQLELVEKRILNEIPDTLVFCSHPPVVTLGRGSKRERDLAGWSGDVVDTQRGGKATYHGPGQVIGYPILDLKSRGSDLHKYLRYLEQVLVFSLRHYGVEADGGRVDATGVWVGPKKVASIGIGVRRWVSFHGFAFNLHKDNLAFTGINPCGFRTSDMTSLEELIGQKIPHADFQAVVRAHFL